MTREQLIEKLNYICNPDNTIGASVYLLLKSEDGEHIKFADINSDLEVELRKQFIDYIKAKFTENEDLSFKNISEADERKNVAYKYDLDEYPDGLHLMNELLDNEERPNFSFTDDDLSSIRAFLITLGNDQNSILIYKRFYPVSLLKRGSVLRMIPASTRFEKMDNNIININDTFEFMLVDGELIINSVKALERHFGFDEIIKSRAEETVNAIDGKNFLEDIDTVKGLIGDKRYARKLMKIGSNSPVLSVPVGNVIGFIKDHPKLKNKIRFTDDESKIKLDTNVSKDLFIKLLNDDYLRSELTSLYYDSLTKDNINTSLEEEENS